MKFMFKAAVLAAVIVNSGCVSLDKSPGRGVAQASNSYQKKIAFYDKAINQLKVKADQSLKTNDSKQIANAHLALARTQARARKDGITCDSAYLSDLIGNVQISTDYSPWIQKYIKTFPDFRNTFNESLSMHLISSGLVKGTVYNLKQLRHAIYEAIQDQFSLGKAQPGVYSLGEVQVSKGKANDFSGFFTEEGEYKMIDSGPLPVDVFIEKNKLYLKIGESKYIIRASRKDQPVFNNFISTDTIEIKSIDGTGKIDESYEKSLFVFPGECEA